MRRILITLLAVNSIAAACPARADTPEFTLVKDKSFLKFIAIQNGAPVEGKFADFTADIHFDHDKLDQSNITVEVNTGSVTSSNEDVEKYLKMPDWLSTAAFPTAVFKCDKLTRMPNSENYYSTCQLTLRGKTMPEVLNFQMERFNGQRAITNGYVTLRRSDFGVGQGDWAKDDVVKNEVRVEFRVVADKK